MHPPETVRAPVDRWLGTSPLAIHLRLFGAAGLFALAAVLHGHASLRADILWATVTAIWVALFPRLRDLERSTGGGSWPGRCSP